MVRLAATIALPLALVACGTKAEPPPAIADDALAGHVLFVTNKGEDTLSKVDLGTGAEVQRVDSCTQPHELAISPNGEHLALGCYGGTALTVFRTGDLALVNTIELGDNARPHGLIWHPDGAIYATAEGRQSIFRVRNPLADSPDVAEFATDKAGSHMLDVAADGATAWTADMQSATVTRVDMAGGGPPRSVTLGSEPEGIDLSPDGESLWVSARGANEAYELDPETLAIRRTVATGAFPLRLAIRPQGDVAITSDLADGGLSVIDLASGELVRSITVSGPEEAEDHLQVTILWSRDGSRIYAAETGMNTVAEIDYVSGEVSRRFAVGEAGDGLAILAPSPAE